MATIMASAALSDNLIRSKTLCRTPKKIRIATIIRRITPIVIPRKLLLAVSMNYGFQKFSVIIRHTGYAWQRIVDLKQTRRYRLLLLPCESTITQYFYFRARTSYSNSLPDELPIWVPQGHRFILFQISGGSAASSQTCSSRPLNHNRLVTGFSCLHFKASSTCSWLLFREPPRLKSPRES